MTRLLHELSTAAIILCAVITVWAGVKVYQREFAGAALSDDQVIRLAAESLCAREAVEAWLVQRQVPISHGAAKGIRSKCEQ